MGSVTKVHAIYERPFWRDEGLNGQVVSDDGVLRSTFDDSPPDDSHGAIVGFVAGNECRQFERLGPAARATGGPGRARAGLRPGGRPSGRTGRPALAGRALHPGGPVAISVPGALTGFARRYASRSAPVHWAGTETATEWCGYLDGALSSGTRAAAEVLLALGYRGPADEVARGLA